MAASSADRLQEGRGEAEEEAELTPATPSVSLACPPPGKISAHGTAAVLDLSALCCAPGWGPLAQEKERPPTRSQDETERSLSLSQ
jgi:hypothetical protein